MYRTLLAMLLLIAIDSARAEPAPEGCSEHFLGSEMPNVTQSRRDGAHVLCFSGFAVLYSPRTKTPLWSAEHLTRDRIRAADILTRPNPGPFHEEPRLPKADRSKLTDYRGTGFDRGHMAPNGDMATKDAQRESFSLVNIIPQEA